MTLSRSEPVQGGIRVQLRLIVSHPPEQRFDALGAELLQIRGKVVDELHDHPEVAVRFSGQRRGDLYRWAKPGKHLGVDGFLEVKVWQPNGRPRLALLVDAVSIFPLLDLANDLSKAGLFNPRARPSADVSAAPVSSKAERAALLRKELEGAGA